MVVRILMISHVSTNSFGGAWNVSANIHSQLSNMGHSVDLYGSDDIIGKGIHQKLKYGRTIVQRFSKKFADYDVVDVTGPFAADVFLHIRRNTGRRPVLVSRTYGLETIDDLAEREEVRMKHMSHSIQHRIYSRWVEYKLRESVRLADVFIAPTCQDINFIRHKGWKGSPVRCATGLGVSKEIELAAELRTKDYNSIGLTNHKMRVLWWGSWVPRKGNYYIADAIRLAMDSGIDLELTLGGIGEAHDLVKDFFNNVGLQPTLLKTVSEEQKAAIMTSNDVILFPSLSEGFGISLLEGMLAGCIPITARTGLGNEIVDGVHGIIVSQVSSTSLAHALRRIKEMDTDERFMISENARRFAECYTWSNAARQTENAYQAGEMIIMNNNKFD